MCLAATANVCTSQFISHGLIIHVYRTLKESTLWNFNSRLLKVEIKQLYFKQRKRREYDVDYHAAWHDRVLLSSDACFKIRGRKSTPYSTLPM